MKLLAEFDCEYCGKKNFTELLLQSQAAVSKRGTWHRKTTLEQMKEEATKMASTNLHGDFLSLGRDSKIYLSKQFIGRAVCAECLKEQSFTRYNKLLRRLNGFLVLFSLLLTFVLSGVLDVLILAIIPGALIIFLITKSVFVSRLQTQQDFRSDKGPWFFDSADNLLQHLNRRQGMVS
ncbi:MAG: hypothetical protein ACOX7B_00275 [Christensenellales bacterium]|jgi:hypothetical protein